MNCGFENNHRSAAGAAFLLSLRKGHEGDKNYSRPSQLMYNIEPRSLSLGSVLGFAKAFEFHSVR